MPELYPLTLNPNGCFIQKTCFQTRDLLKSASSNDSRGTPLAVWLFHLNFEDIRSTFICEKLRLCDKGLLSFEELKQTPQIPNSQLITTK